MVSSDYFDLVMIIYLHTVIWFQVTNDNNNQNTVMSPGDLRRLDVTQTPMKNHQLTVV